MRRAVGSLQRYVHPFLIAAERARAGADLHRVDDHRGLEIEPECIDGSAPIDGQGGRTLKFASVARQRDAKVVVRDIDARLVGKQ